MHVVEFGDCFSQLSGTSFSGVFIHYDHAQKKCTSKIRGGKKEEGMGWVGNRKSHITSTVVPFVSKTKMCRKQFLFG